MIMHSVLKIILSRSLVRRLQMPKENAFLNGDGTGKPTGIFAETGGGQVVSTLTAAIKSDDLIDLVYGLKRPYRKNASLVMNNATLTHLES